MFDPVTLLEFILFFGLTLFLHEFGHFVFAKIFGIKVEEFGFGYPPRMVKLFKIKETQFTFNWIPFGAFVRFAGDADLTSAGGLMNAKPWKRILVLLGGPLMNLATGVVLFTLLFSQVGVPDATKVQIASVEPDSPAAAAGIQAGDLVTQVNQTPITDENTLIQLIQANKGVQVEILLERNGQSITTTSIPRVNPPPGQGSLGILLTNPLVQVPWIDTVPLSIKATFNQCVAILQMPGQLISGKIPKDQARVVGVVGMYSMFSQARQKDVQNAGTNNPIDKTFTLRLLIVISIALGLTNLLPIPALDGARILFALPELLFRKRIPPKYENIVHLIGFFAMIILMFYVTFQDIFNPIRLP